MTGRELYPRLAAVLASKETALGRRGMAKMRHPPLSRRPPPRCCCRLTFLGLGILEPQLGAAGVRHHAIQQ